MDRDRRGMTVAAIVLCLALMFGGQAVADSLVPEASAEVTSQAVGRAASSYLSGIRVFGAAILWNRIDVIYHGYYREAGLTEQRFILSTIAIVQALDPGAVQSYYVGSWVLVRNDRVADGLAMAERGVEHNPQSGILRTNAAQLRMLFGDDLEGAVEMAESLIDNKDEMVWTDSIEEHNAYPILGAIFRAGGRDDLDALVQLELERIDEEAGDLLGEEDHDHDHDGVPDH
ncbi:MAG: hypothetical protein U1E08_00740 [Coriobacteriia bacterium]|nr:hypothetical protein [Coriobacteriia bacterium]